MGQLEFMGSAQVNEPFPFSAPLSPLVSETLCYSSDGLAFSIHAIYFSLPAM
jgi:hypothetical protein